MLNQLVTFVGEKTNQTNQTTKPKQTNKPKRGYSSRRKQYLWLSSCLQDWLYHTFLEIVLFEVYFSTLETLTSHVTVLGSCKQCLFHPLLFYRLVSFVWVLVVAVEWVLLYTELEQNNFHMLFTWKFSFGKSEKCSEATQLLQDSSS